jgi:hypothetical protein
LLQSKGRIIKIKVEEWVSYNIRNLLLLSKPSIVARSEVGYCVPKVLWWEGIVLMEGEAGVRLGGAGALVEFWWLSKVAICNTQPEER